MRLFPPQKTSPGQKNTATDGQLTQRKLLTQNYVTKLCCKAGPNIKYGGKIVGIAFCNNFLDT